MASFTQAHRVIGIGTPLKGDNEQMLLRSFEASERLGQMFTIDAVMYCESDSIDYKKIVGQNVTIRVDLKGGATRYFNGMVSRFFHTGAETGLARYRATIVPNLWRLSRKADCRIFQKLSVPDILKKVLAGLDVRYRLEGTYPQREYCVQYRETDFNFISRLMEQEGIYYFFEHADGQHTMVVCDSAAAHQPASGYDNVPYHLPQKHLHGAEYILDWTVEEAIQSAAFAQRDFDFEAPKKSLDARAAVSLIDGDDDLEIYDYPGEYLEKSNGDERAKVRLQELQAGHETVYGHGDVRGIAAGYTFNLTDFPRDDQNKEYLVTSMNFRASIDEFESTSGGAGGRGEPVFSCTFTAIDAQRQFRPPRITPKPVVQGPQTAIVVGPAGEEIYTDEYGRIKLKFHWDRYSKGDESSSCWVRVSQAWAGKKYGALFLPRVGHEVVVDFLEGDPDQPLVTGRVYNGSNMPPYDLPANKTMSTTKGVTSPGAAGFNEIRFEDKKGKEQIFVRAERNYDLRAKADAFVTVGNDCHTIIGHDQYDHVKNDRHEIVENDHVGKVKGNFAETIHGDETRAVNGKVSLTVDKDVGIKITGNSHHDVTGDVFVKGKNVVIEATSNLTIKVGSSYIAIEASGITISTSGNIEVLGTKGIEVSSPKEVKAGVGNSTTTWSPQGVDTSGAKLSIAATGMAEISGAMVKIN